MDTNKHQCKPQRGKPTPRRNRGRGDHANHQLGQRRPSHLNSVASEYLCLGPHKWAVGTTFEWEFDFPMRTNPAYEAKPAPKRKARTSANPKAESAPARKTSKPATPQTATDTPSEKPKRVHLNPDERRERARARAVEHRQKLKEAGLCRDCRQPAILGQTRCLSCADKHRQSRQPAKTGVYGTRVGRISQIHPQPGQS